MSKERKNTIKKVIVIIIAVLAVIGVAATIIAVTLSSKKSNQEADPNSEMIEVEEDYTPVKGQDTDGLPGKRMEWEAFDEIKEKTSLKEKAVEIDGKTIVIEKTTMNEIASMGFEFETDLTEKSEVDFISSGSFDFVSNGDTYGEMILYSIRGDEITEITVEGTKAIFDKTEFKDFINNGWNVKGFYVEKDALTTTDTVEAVLSKGETDIFACFTYERGTDITLATLYSVS